jgi:2-polyprenyl-3-methyl-5-hydroxy-6-metoxy-1,4-benzoquinol methylase
MTEEFITFYYKEIYGKVKRKSVSPVDLYNMQKIRKSSAALYKKLEQYAGKDGSVLDFGAGPGGRLDEFKNQGFKDLCIFDHDEKYMEYGISQGLKADEPSKKYNIIIISHVVEHLGDPLGVLKNLAARLVPGGHMYIEVPMYENSRNLVRHFHLAHKYYFSASSLTLLAAMSGLVKVKSYKNAIVVTPGAVDTSFFSEEKAAEVWSARSRIIRRREFFRRFEWLLKGK